MNRSASLERVEHVVLYVVRTGPNHITVPTHAHAQKIHRVLELFHSAFPMDGDGPPSVATHVYCHYASLGEYVGYTDASSLDIARLRATVAALNAHSYVERERFEYDAFSSAVLQLLGVPRREWAPGTSCLCWSRMRVRSLK